MTRGFQLFLQTGHDTHAFEGGTIVAAARRQGRSFSSGPADDSGSADLFENGLQRASPTEVRQGYRRAPRHVAPALLLC